ncbi:heparan-alpha-glucosaminide N-acetyltransferase-like isoform X2 [Littorina saxatilis]|uniref:heparan-alpha-glucosaminide N-acetyltransferase-like isoform X2 n=1 Tax=Littorina saxatilis TaxID=31220 RepID=UPI0038B52E1E
MAAARVKMPSSGVLLAAGLQVFLATVIQAEALIPIIPVLCKSNDIPDFKIDTARLTIDNDQRSNMDLVLYMQSKECHECDLRPVARIDTNCTVLVDTRWPTRVEIRPLNGTIMNTTLSCCASNNTHLFQERGEYTIFIQQNEEDDMDCRFAPMNAPPDANIPIYIAIGMAFFLAVFWAVVKTMYKRGVFHRIICFWSTESVMSDFGTPTSINPTDEAASGSNNAEQTKVKKERLRSLDTFRGLSLTIMIFVNYGGGGYWQYTHSIWDGLTVADLVFPWFVYIMGTALMLSFQGQLRRGTPKINMFWKIVRRSIILFALGLLINSGGKSDGVDLSRFRIPGVLQRFAGTYLIVATIHLIFARPYDESRYGKFAAIRDMTEFWPEWVFHLILVGVHTAITFGMNVPGCPTGYLGAGGDAAHGQHRNCTGGAAGYIDRKVFGDSHIYNNPTCKEIYHTTVPFDPEGLLGTLTSVFMCFLGLQAGKILFIHKDWVQRYVRFLIWGIALGVIAGVLCKFSKDDGWIPINKNLWSLSFVIALAAMAFVLLAFCYLLIDVYKVWSGAPFYYAGMNPILLYVGHELLTGRFPVSFDVVVTHPAQLAMNLWGATFWVLVALYLYYKGIFISV